ncbi:hypothetical protein Hanom_Chr10g00937351 [Helianthus anomalus]
MYHHLFELLYKIPLFSYITNLRYIIILLHIAFIRTHAYFLRLLIVISIPSLSYMLNLNQISFTLLSNSNGELYCATVYCVVISPAWLFLMASAQMVPERLEDKAAASTPTMESVTNPPNWRTAM